LINNACSLLGPSVALEFDFVFSAETMRAVMDNATMTKRTAKRYWADNVVFFTASLDKHGADFRRLT
jgi:hypothetical protein